MHSEKMRGFFLYKIEIGLKYKLNTFDFLKEDCIFMFIQVMKTPNYVFSIKGLKSPDIPWGIVMNHDK